MVIIVVNDKLINDEADQVEDKLKCVKDLLADIDRNKSPQNLWIFATNYIEEIDSAVYKNKEHLRFKLDFSWNKNIFLDYAMQNNTLSFLNHLTPLTYSDKEVQSTELLGNAIKNVGTKYDEVYFQYLQMLNKFQSDFLANFNKLIEFQKFTDHLIPAFNYQEWKSAISEHCTQVTKLEIVNEHLNFQINLTNNFIVPSDNLLSLVFEYLLNLFWIAEAKNKLDTQWDIVDPYSFLVWVKEKGYSLEQTSLSIYRDKDEQGIYYYIAKFTPKIFASARITNRSFL